MTFPSRMSLETLGRAMPEMAPLATLGHRFREGLTDGFALCARVSAFPKFAESLDDLIAWIDHESAEVLDAYRRRLQGLIGVMGTDQAVYCLHHRHHRGCPQHLASLVDPASANTEIAQALSERCEADLFVPSMGVVLLGHDEFGCWVLACRSRPNSMDWMAGMVAACQLHLLVAVDVGGGSFRWVRHGHGEA